MVVLTAVEIARLMASTQMYVPFSIIRHLHSTQLAFSLIYIYILYEHRFQETLGKTIHSRKEPHVTHEELVQITKWKLIRGKNRPRLLDLVRINTELAVSQATKKAFKKVAKDLNSAINALTNLKGIGPQTASAVLCAGYPEHCPFMADEAMLATPGVEASDYTLAEFVNFATQIKSCTEKLKELGKCAVYM